MKNTATLAPEKKNTAQEAKKQQWAAVEKLMNRYFETYETQYKEEATAKLWELSLREFVNYARKRRVSVGRIGYQPAGTTNSDGLIGFTESLLISMFRVTGTETIVKKYQEYCDARAESDRESIPLHAWMVRRLWWKMQDRWEREKKKPSSQLSKGEQDAFETMKDESTEENPGKVLFDDLLEKAALEDDELKALDQYLAGQTRKEAAEYLGITEGVYKYRLEVIFEKLKKAGRNMGENESSAKEA